jgi:diguanylate cyclase (GGDEF)-like protein
MKIPLMQSLNFKHARHTLVAALCVGILLAILQIRDDYQKTRRGFDTQMQQALSALQAPATEAAYNLDEKLALQVLNGLFNSAPILFATIQDDFGRPLGRLERPRQESNLRWLSELLFGGEREYVQDLQVKARLVGKIRIRVDLYLMAQEFFSRLGLTMLFGLFNSLLIATLLFIVTYRNLTRSLVSLMGQLARIDLENPTIQPIALEPQHEQDELGQVAQLINHTLQGFEKTLRLRHQAEQDLAYLASHDTLTGLPNRAAFQRELAQALETAKQSKQCLSLLYLDLDRFKNINDTLGHSIGDTLLRAVAERLTTINIHIARLGGDEFTGIIQPCAGNRAEAVASMIISLFDYSYDIENYQLFIGVSIGISRFPLDGHSADTLLKHADAAMYEAKREGRNTFRFYQASLGEAIEQAVSLEHDLRHALERDEFTLCYQPQIDIQSRRIIGVEALIRWQHPVYGAISPSRFIPVAEETGLIIGIGEWALYEACRAAQRWRSEGLAELQVAVNVSPRQITGTNVAELAEAVLQAHGLPPRLLCLEVTESVFVNDQANVFETFQQLRELGVTIALDDFGTGYSSIGYMKRLSFDKLKIDASFIRGLFVSERDTALVTTMINLGHNMGMKTIAEGVETNEQYDFLREQGCDALQGFLFSQPLTDAVLCQEWLGVPAIKDLA